MNKDYSAIASRDEESPMVNTHHDLTKKDWKKNTPLLLLTGLFLGVAFLAGQYSGGRGATAVISGILDDRAMASSDDICVSGATIEILKAEELNLRKYISEHITPEHWKEMTKPFVLSLPSVVEILENFDDSRSLSTCANLDFSIVGIVGHKGQACITGDSITYNGCIQVLGNDIACNSYSIGGNTNFPIAAFPVPGGTAKVTLEASVSGKWIRLCGVIDWWWPLGEDKACSPTIYL